MTEPSYFTINACNRCRKRKARCDAGIPTCVPCRNSGSACEYSEARSKQTLPRSFVYDLEKEVAKLEDELRRKRDNGMLDPAEREGLRPAGSASTENSSNERDHDETHADLIRTEPGGDAHFLGVSSGMHLARSVLETAQRSNAGFDSLSQNGQAQPASAAAPTNDGAKGVLTPCTVMPSKDVATNLVEIFFSQYQVQYPILAEDTFRKTVAEYYDENPSRDPGFGDIWTRFMLNMVFSIALLFLSRENKEAAVLAEGFRSNALASLTAIIQTKCLDTLQCLLLALLSSTLGSSTMPIWYISGLCMRMCVDLGLHSETTIRTGSGEGPAVEDEIDSRRRLFWVTYSFDRTMSTLLGRPFTFNNAALDVQFPSKTLSTQRKALILHWLELQQLQGEIIHRLYHIRDSSSTSLSLGSQSDLREWTEATTKKLRAWSNAAHGMSDPNGHNIDWWEYWYQNAMLILYRPSPSKPDLGSQQVAVCYAAAKSLIQLSYIRVNKGLTDFTWVDLHCQLMGGITLLFLVWKSAEARAEACRDWITFKSCLLQWKSVLGHLADRWERMSRAREALASLSDATLDLIEKETTKSHSRPGGSKHSGPGMRRVDRARRKSIIQQLKPTVHETTSTHSASVEAETATISPSHDNNTNHDPNMAGNNAIPIRYDLSGTSQGDSPVYNRTSPWSNPDFSNQPQIDMQFDSNLMQEDLTGMLGGDLWLGFESDTSMNLPMNFGLWDYFSAAENNGLMNDAWTGQADELMMGSILNFRGDMVGDQEDGQDLPHEPIGQQGHGDTNVGYGDQPQGWQQ